MANSALLHLPLKGSLDGRDRNGVVSATAVGPVRFTADGYFAEEGTTNYIANPRFQSLPNGWVRETSWDGVLDTTVLSARSPSQRLTVNTTGKSHYVRANVTGVGTFAPGDPVTASIDVTSQVARLVRVVLYPYDAAGALIGSGAQWTDVTTTPGQFTRVTTTIATLPANTSQVTVFVYSQDSAAAVGEQFWISRPQIEKKSYATSYTDGSMGTGYSWAGTAHASASTRAASYLSLTGVGGSRLKSDQGSIAARVHLVTDINATRAIASVGLFGTLDRITFYFTSATENLVGYTKNGAAAQNQPIRAASTPRNATHAQFMKWDAGTVGVAQDTDAWTDVARSGGYSGSFGGQTLWIGSADGTAMLGGYLSDLMIFDRPLTDAERATLAATPEWSFDSLQQKPKGVMHTNITI